MYHFYKIIYQFTFKKSLFTKTTKLHYNNLNHKSIKFLIKIYFYMKLNKIK